MSWFKEAAGGAAPPTFKEAPEKLTEDDPYIPGRKVTNKAANRPFLAYVQPTLHTLLIPTLRVVSFQVPRIPQETGGIA
jgi:hypothetical protein